MLPHAGATLPPLMHRTVQCHAATAAGTYNYAIVMEAVVVIVVVVMVALMQNKAKTLFLQRLLLPSRLPLCTTQTLLSNEAASTQQGWVSAAASTQLSG